MNREKLYKDANEQLSLRRSSIPISAVRAFLKDFKESLLEKISIKSTEWSNESINEEKKSYTLQNFAILSCRQGTSFERDHGDHNKPIIVRVDGFERIEGNATSYAGIGWGEGNNPREAYEDLLKVLEKD